MLDNSLIDLVATQLELAIKNAGWTYVVLQKDQPRLEGIPAAGAVFLEKLVDDPDGWPAAALTYDATNDRYNETSKNWIRTPFQISAIIPQDPSNLTLPTASDVANRLRMHMVSRYVIRLYSAQFVNVMNVTQVRNPSFTDDKQRFEFHPSFDLTVVHMQSLVNIVPAVHRVEGTDTIIL